MGKLKGNNRVANKETTESSINEFLRKKKEEREAAQAALEDANEEPDFESLRRQVLRKLDEARSKTIDVDPEALEAQGKVSLHTMEG